MDLFLLWRAQAVKFIPPQRTTGAGCRNQTSPTKQHHILDGLCSDSSGPG